jgi:Tfp pilus assembly protein PilF
VDHSHRLHWTGRDQNWNYQCAECHSTNLKKGYDLATDSFQTTWSDINVACEACHGPASRHVEQARSATADKPPTWDVDKGLEVDLADRDGAVWTHDDQTGLPRRSVPRARHTQIEVCARCFLETTDPNTLLECGLPLLDDPLLAVRTEAARTLAPLARFTLPEADKRRLEAGLTAYRASQLVNAERPESHLNLGLIEAASGDSPAAEQAYRTALRLDPNFGPAYVNLADLDRALGRDAEGEQALREGLARLPEEASLHHALGLLLVRKQDMPGAVASLTRAAELAPDNPRYAYVRALAVERAGDPPQALAILQTALARHPGNRDLLAALVSLHQARGDQDAASEFARQLRPRSPDSSH